MKNRRMYGYSESGTASKNEHNAAAANKDVDSADILDAYPLDDDAVFKQRISKRRAQRKHGKKRSGVRTSASEPDDRRARFESEQDEVFGVRGHPGYEWKSKRIF